MEQVKNAQGGPRHGVEATVPQDLACLFDLSNQRHYQALPECIARLTGKVCGESHLPRSRMTMRNPQETVSNQRHAGFELFWRGLRPDR